MGSWERPRGQPRRILAPFKLWTRTKEKTKENGRKLCFGHFSHILFEAVCVFFEGTSLAYGSGVSLAGATP